MTRWPIRRLYRFLPWLLAGRGSSGGALRGSAVIQEDFYLLAGQSVDYYLRAGTTDKYKRSGT